MFAQVTVEGSANTFGDAQLSVDVIADEIMWEVAKGSEVVAYGASEEEPEIVKCNPKGEYTICWDPLDGSSIVDNNWAVGTIIGVFVRGVLLSCGAGVWRLASGRVATPFRRLTPLRHRREAGHDVAPASGRRRRGTPETPPPTRDSREPRRETKALPVVVARRRRLGQPRSRHDEQPLGDQRRSNSDPVLVRRMRQVADEHGPRRVRRQ